MNKNEATADAVPGPSPDDVDKIRDIIFGGQMREYAARFEQLEQQVVDSLDAMSKQLDKRFEKLELTLKAKTDELHEKVKGEANQRGAELDELNGIVAAESKTLSALIEKTHAELSKALETDTARLERQKVASKDLSQLFTELAQQVKQIGK